MGTSEEAFKGVAEIKKEELVKMGPDKKPLRDKEGNIFTKSFVLKDWEQRHSAKSEKKFGKGDFWVLLIEHNGKEAKLLISGKAIDDQLNYMNEHGGKDIVKAEGGVKTALDSKKGEMGEYWVLKLE
jgi:hypothetical protein